MTLLEKTEELSCRTLPYDICFEGKMHNTYCKFLVILQKSNFHLLLCLNYQSEAASLPDNEG